MKTFTTVYHTPLYHIPEGCNLDEKYVVVSVIQAEL
jgi:hypothetical protein